MTEKKEKFGLFSIVLLGINSIIGTGIFLLPNRAYALMGPASLGILLFDAFLAGALALCFAEAAGFFSRNGGPYHLTDFIGIIGLEGSFPGTGGLICMPKPPSEISGVMRSGC